MPAPRQLRQRRLGRAPRVRPAAFRKAHAPHTLRIAARLESVVRAEFYVLIERVLRTIDPLLLARGARRDAISVAELFQSLQTTQRPEATLKKFFNQVNAETDRALAARLPELPIAAVVRNGAQLEEQWIRKNTDLLNAGPRVRRAVERVISQPLDRGLSVRDIKKQLQTQMGIEARRAELIARDQTLKLAGQLQQARQTQAGIRRYVWTTSEDERVRPDHAALDGTIQSWDAPPVVDKRTGRRAHPGGDFACRCNADPQLDEPLTEAEPQAEPILSDEPPDESLAAPEPGPGAEPASEETAPEQQGPSDRLQALEEERQRLAQAEADREAERAAAEQARLEADRQAAQAAAQQRALETARLELEAAERARVAAAGRQAAARAKAKAPLPRAEAIKALQKLAGRIQLGPNVDPGEVHRLLTDQGADVLFAERPIGSLELAANKTGKQADDLAFGEINAGAGLFSDPNYHGAGSYIKVASDQVNASPDKMAYLMTRKAEYDAAIRQVGGTPLEAVGPNAEGKLPEFVEVIGRDFDATLTHEFGHAVHLSTFGPHREIDALVAARYSAPDREPIGRYASENRYEYFAEAYTAYRFHPERLRRVAPKAYALVQEVLRLRGMP